MTPTPVGMRCPECSRQKTKVRTAATLTGEPTVTYFLIAVNVIAFVAMTASGGSITDPGGTVYQHGALFGPLVADGEWWRIVTAGFLHAGIIHIAFNMYFLYFLGTLIEPAIGRLRFGLIYAVSLLGGSFGALLLTPNSPTVGASGAVFGLMGAAILAMRARGIDPMQSGLGVTLLLNLGITFLIPGISKGGHAGCIALGVALAIGCVVVAQSATPALS
jgi:membrane associated rhomboid family serine protease